jgi:hypothetical protein
MTRPPRSALAACAGAALLLTPLATGCAGKRPVLYPNRALVSAGPELADDDVDRCIQSAQDYGLDTRRGERVAEHTAARGAVGGAAGAAGGAVLGDAGTGAATGAAAGAAAGFVRGLLRARDPDPLHRRYVEICLRNQGYQIIGWK